MEELVNKVLLTSFSTAPYT